MSLPYRAACLLLAFLGGAPISGCSIADPQPNRFARQIEYGNRLGLDTGGRDALPYFQAAAETETDPRLRPRYYRDLADTQGRRGNSAAALGSYEAAALLGDRPSGAKVLKAQVSGAYAPRDQEGLAKNVYVARAENEKSAAAALLLAELVGSGRVEAGKFRDENRWLQLAAANGSNEAYARLAERAEEKGDIAAAADYDKRSHPDMSTGERALVRARRLYAGEDGSPRNRRIALAWLDYAKQLDRLGSAKLAARLHRAAASDGDRARLAAIARAGGIDVAESGGGGFLTAYRDATTEAERERILGRARAAARGNADAAYAAGRILAEVEGEPGTQAQDFFAKAVSGGNARALPFLLDRLAILEQGDPRARTSLAALEKAARGGNTEAMRGLARLYSAGGPVAPDPAESNRWLLRAADAGDADAQFRAGVLLADAGAPNADIDGARAYLRSSAAKGNASAAAFLGTLQP